MCDDEIERDYSPEEISAMYLESFRRSMKHDEKLRKIMADSGMELGDTFLESAKKNGVEIPDEIMKEHSEHRRDK